MIIPIKCFTCGNVLANKYLYYVKEVRKMKIKQGIDMEEVVIKEESDLIGKKLRDAKISEKAGLIVLAISTISSTVVASINIDELPNYNQIFPVGEGLIFLIASAV